MTAWLRHCADGLVLSAPVAATLLATQIAAAPRLAQLAAMAAVLIAIPWIMPAWVVLAVLSSPLFIWLLVHGQTLDVMSWLGKVMLVAAVVGCHVNGVLLASWWRKRHRMRAADDGLGTFLRRTQDG